MLKTRTWVVILSLALLLFGGLAWWLQGRSASGTVANVYQDGALIASYDLSLISGTETVEVVWEDGSNTIQLEHGRICIAAADCPDQVCVRSGWLSDSAAPIVCLPHRLVIRLEQSGGEAASSPLDIDTVAQ